MAGSVDALSESKIRVHELSALHRQTLLQFSDKHHERRRDVILVNILPNLVGQTVIYHNFR